MDNFIVLEKWHKGGYTNRLVTDGKTLWMEYLSKYNVNNGGSRKWEVDYYTYTDDFYLKNFR